MQPLMLSEDETHRLIKLLNPDHRDMLQQHTHLPRLFTTVQIPQLKGRANVLITLSRSLFFSRLSSAHTHTHTHTPNLCYSHTDSY